METTKPEPSTQKTTAEPDEPKEIAPPTVQNVQPAEVEEEGPTRTAYIEMAQDDTGDWHWCLWSANGRAMAASVKPFKRRNDCQNAVETALQLFRNPKLTITATIGG